MNETASGDLTPLGQEIDHHLQRLEWSQRKLAREADMDSGAISRLMRGLQTPTHETIEKIADALRIDVLHLKEVAGLRVVTPPAQRNSRVEYIAQRLEALPPDVREEAIAALEAQLDTIYKVAGLGRRGRSQSAGSGPELQHLIDELIGLAHKVHDREPEALSRVFEQLSQQLPPQNPGDNTEPPSGQQRKAS